MDSTNLFHQNLVLMNDQNQVYQIYKVNDGHLKKSIFSSIYHLHNQIHASALLELYLVENSNFELFESAIGKFLLSPFTVYLHIHRDIYSSNLQKNFIDKDKIQTIILIQSLFRMRKQMWRNRCDIQ
jgi:hypothetical protein